MKSRGMEFKVGLLVVVAIAVLVSFVVILGNFSLGSGYNLYVNYSFSGNIQAGAPVKLSGIKVGKVQEVNFWGGKVDQNTGKRVQVRLKVWVEERVRESVRKDAEFFVNTQGVLGEQYLEIVPGSNYTDPPLPSDAVVDGTDPPRTDLIVARLFTVLDQLSKVLTEDRDFIDSLLRNSASAVNELNDILVANKENVGKLIVSADGFALTATETLKKVNQGLQDPKAIGRLLQQGEAVLAQADQSLATLTPPAKNFLQDATRVTGLITKDRLDKVVAVADGVVGTTGKAQKLLQSADTLVSHVAAGKGTAGALIMREELYADLREMIRDLKRNPWKFFWKE